MIYIATSFGILEATDFFGSRYQWHEKAVDLVLGILSIGCFLLLLNSLMKWDSKRYKLIGYILNSLTVMPLLYLLINSFEVSANNELPNDHAIAVLPLNAISNDQASVWFGAGITDDIFNSLGKIEGIALASRTSAYQFRKTSKSAAQIAKELSVRYLVEGSVRKHQSEIRVVIGLIDARTDRHIWSETYDTSSDQIFEVQSAIALNIAQSMQIALNPETKMSLLDRSGFELKKSLYRQASRQFEKEQKERVDQPFHGSSKGLRSDE